MADNFRTREISAVADSIRRKKMKIIKIEISGITKRRISLIWIFFFLSICFAAASLAAEAQPTDSDGDGVPDYRDNCPTTPNPEKIVFTSTRDGNSEIYVMNSDGSNQINLTDNSVFDGDPSFSPNGAKIAFMSFRDGNPEIYVMKADGNNQTRLTNAPGTDGDPSFSPDGNRIVFTSTRDGNFEVYVMNSDGSNQTRLTNTMAEDGEPSFSPDGSKIVFTSNRDGNNEIYIMNADGSGQIRLTNNPAADHAASFSPEGGTIIFTTERDGNFEIYMMSADGSGLINLTNNPAYDAQSAFSPNGDKIAFQSMRNGNFEIYVMNYNGFGPFNLTNMGESDLEPKWGTQADSDSDGIGDACDNTAPTIETFNITRQQGTFFYPLAIARVFDPDETIRTMTFTINGSESATVNGVTVSDIDNSFALGVVRARVSAACGATSASFILRVTDSGGLSSQETLHVTVLRETSPPVINLRPGGIELFPPNHKYTIIGVNQLVASVSDNCTALTVGDVVIKKVTSDEADDARGGSDGNTVNDIVIAPNCRSVGLRAERDGNRNGRVYTITLLVRDAAGNSTRAEYKISVPKNQNGFPAIRDATAMTIFGNCS
jgi:dipeptidyl aminopeptidase/acylaminoacyl peptidase